MPFFSNFHEKTRFFAHFACQGMQTPLKTSPYQSNFFGPILDLSYCLPGNACTIIEIHPFFGKIRVFCTFFEKWSKKSYDKDAFFRKSPENLKKWSKMVVFSGFWVQKWCFSGFGRIVPLKSTPFLRFLGPKVVKKVLFFEFLDLQNTPPF